MESNAEKNRLRDCNEKNIPWKKWGPYLSERQWGTVREDYSEDGNAWDYFSHDQSRSRAYRWGEDGMAGVCDNHGVLCFALALWNGRDPILKERMFGLTNSEGNHGEDVKEYYYYLDSTPTHSYMKYLYKYPQAAFPYDDLVRTNRGRSRNEMEYELIDTGVFADDRYFDVFVEYAKAGPEDLLIRITVENRGPEAAAIHVLPTLWFRNTWFGKHAGSRPVLRALEGGKNGVVLAHHTDPLMRESLSDYYLYCDSAVPLLFTENDTNNERIFGKPNDTPYVKDGINNYVVNGRKDAVNPGGCGTKVSPHFELTVGAKGSKSVQLRLTSTAMKSPFADFEGVFKARLQEADEFYASITPASTTPDAAMVMRQALAGMLWSKQYYYFDADLWLEQHGAHPLHADSKRFRNSDWFHMVNDDVISMPDKWEYPWYAAWDLAFHTIPLSIVDPEFAKSQLEIMLTRYYLHPNGQVPAYEWNFGDVNPPVHAWATIFLHRTEKALRGEADMKFLASAFTKLLLNFTWWLNRKDRFGKNVFEGGFLGLDNIGVFDRSAPLPTGGYLEQADGTAWMALFSQNMGELAVELVTDDPHYEEMVAKFIDHFLFIAAAMNRPGEDGMWDEEDGFYYDLLRLPDGSAQRLKVRSLVGLLPLCATTVVEEWQRERLRKANEMVVKRWTQMPELLASIHPTGPGHFGVHERGIMALVNPERLRRILSRMLDEEEFLSPHGIRSISKYHEKHPYVFRVGEQEYRVDYLPAESNTGMFGGNSNWRGPVWMPVNVLLMRALLNFHLYYGDNFKIECPTGSGVQMNLFEVAHEIARRLIGIFLRDEHGRRPVFGAAEKFQNDPYWRDHLLFYEYFHGDNGAGIGASHQTGWTGVVAMAIKLFGALDAESALKSGKLAGFESVARPGPARS